MSESQRPISDEQLYCDVDDKGCMNRADIDTSRYSDIDDFEKLSIPCSEPVSGDEEDACAAATDIECVLKSTRTRQSLKTTPFFVTDLKPPTVSEVCRQSSPSGGLERSPICTELIVLANSMNKLMV